MNNPDKKQKGAIAIFVALTLLMIIPLMGLAIDSGFILLKRNELQNVADASALACLIRNSSDACGVLEDGDNLNLNVTNRKDIEAINPQGYKITTTYPNLPCPKSQSKDCAKAIASYDYKTFFIGIFGIKSVPLSAYAIAAKSLSNCMIASGTIKLNGSPDILGKDCNILMGNADDVGNTAIQSSTNNYIYNGNDPEKCSACTPKAVSMSGPVPIPKLSPLPTWDDDAVNLGSFECKNAACDVQPGYYPNGISCSGANASCKFASGNYYLEGPLELSGANSVGTDNGSGVFFYMRGSGADGKVNISAGGLLSLTNKNGVNGPCNTTNNQLLIYSPNAYNNKQVITLDGGTSSSLVGNIYLPGYDIVWKGGNDLTLNGTMVIANYSQNGSNNLNIRPTISCGLSTKIYLIE